MSGRLVRRVAGWLAKLPLYAGRRRPSFPDLFIVLTWVGLADFSGYAGKKGKSDAQVLLAGLSLIICHLSSETNRPPQTNDSCQMTNDKKKNLREARCSAEVKIGQAVFSRLLVVIHRSAVFEVEHPPAVIPF